MKRAWLGVMLVMSACGGWDELAEQSRRERCLAVPSECDAGVVTGMDAGTEDAGLDAGADAGTDAGSDAGTDAGVDAGTEDAGVDAGVDAGTEEVDAGFPARICTRTSECNPDEVCHPTGLVCAKTCTTTGPGCSTCDFPPGFNHGPKFCSCEAGSCSSSDECNGFDRVCVPRCTQGSCPGGRSCQNGKCDVPPACTFGSCDGGFVCNSQTLVCSSLACDAGAPQPGGCSYGTFCGASARCVEPPQPTCPNHTGSPPWTTASMGPVIYATAEVLPNATFCGGSTVAFKASLSAYSTSAWPFSKDALTLEYVNQGGSRVSMAGQSLMQSSDYSVDGGVATMRLNLCAPNATPFYAGFQFIGGNPVCVLLDGGL